MSVENDKCEVEEMKTMDTTIDAHPIAVPPAWLHRPTSYNYTSDAEAKSATLDHSQVLESELTGMRKLFQQKELERFTSTYTSIDAELRKPNCSIGTTDISDKTEPRKVYGLREIVSLVMEYDRVVCWEKLAIVNDFVNWITRNNSFVSRSYEPYNHRYFHFTQNQVDRLKYKGAPVFSRNEKTISTVESVDCLPSGLFWAEQLFFNCRSLEFRLSEKTRTVNGMTITKDPTIFNRNVLVEDYYRLLLQFKNCLYSWGIWYAQVALSDVSVSDQNDVCFHFV